MSNFTHRRYPRSGKSGISVVNDSSKRTTDFVMGGFNHQMQHNQIFLSNIEVVFRPAGFDHVSVETWLVGGDEAFTRWRKKKSHKLESKNNQYTKQPTQTLYSTTTKRSFKLAESDSVTPKINTQSNPSKTNTFKRPLSPFLVSKEFFQQR